MDPAPDRPTAAAAVGAAGTGCARSATVCPAESSVPATAAWAARRQAG
jgi:hypothetical protein